MPKCPTAISARAAGSARTILYSERTTLYLNYALENERTDNGLRGGRRGNLISGMKRRLSDSSSMFVEERYQETDSMSGLTHATGMTLAPNERWNFGANTDIGTLTDELTGAKIDREAGGVRMGYGFQAVQLSSAVEYRLDKTRAAGCGDCPSARRGCSGTASSSSSTRTGAWSASTTTPRARARSGSSTTAATPKRCSATAIARWRTIGSTRSPSTRTSTTCRRPSR